MRRHTDFRSGQNEIYNDSYSKQQTDKQTNKSWPPDPVSPPNNYG